MATNTINQNVNTAITDFGLIKQAIVNKGVSVPTGTPTSQYGNKISSIQTGADVSGVTATAGDVDTGKVFVDSTGAEVTGISTYKYDYTALNTLVGQTTAVAEDVAQGKVFVNASGVQTTGTASGGGSDTEFIKMVERPNNATITIPNGTTKIGTQTFSGFVSLTNINLPNTLTEIGGMAFEECSFLAITSLPESVTTISPRAFMGCENITNMTLPSGLLTLGANAFSYSGLRALTFLGTPTTISSIALNNCYELETIRVPWSSGAVSGAPWGATNASIEYGYTP